MVVLPSLWEENYPLVVREALLYGTPVIGSNLGGVPEIIEDGVNGYLFDPYREGDLREKVQHILKNPSVLNRLSQGVGKTKIPSLQEHVEKVSHIYNLAV